ncbi:hypothetical protein ACN28S_30005 [Cystobacter fuscus]
MPYMSINGISIEVQQGASRLTRLLQDATPAYNGKQHQILNGQRRSWLLTTATLSTTEREFLHVMLDGWGDALVEAKTNFLWTTKGLTNSSGTASSVAASPAPSGIHYNIGAGGDLVLPLYDAPEGGWFVFSQVRDAGSSGSFQPSIALSSGLYRIGTTTYSIPAPWLTVGPSTIALNNTKNYSDVWFVPRLLPSAWITSMITAFTGKAIPRPPAVIVEGSFWPRSVTAMVEVTGETISGAMMNGIWDPGAGSLSLQLEEV